MSLSKRSVINIVSGGLGYLIPILLNIISIPIILNKLGNEAYGLLNLVNLIIGYLIISDMGLDIPITKYVAEYNAGNNRDKLKSLLNSALQIYIRIGLGGMILVAAFSGILSRNVFKIPDSHLQEARLIFILAGVGFLFSILNLFAKAVFNGLQKYEVSNGLNVLQNLLSILFGIILVLSGGGIVWFVFIRVIFYLLSFCAYVFLIKKEVPEFSLLSGVNSHVWSLLKGQFGYGFILRVGSLFFSRIDQTLIGIWLGVSEVGIYSIPLLIASSISALIGSVTHYVFPKTTELLTTGKKDEFNVFFQRNMKFVSVMAICSFIPVIIFSHEILRLWVGNDVSAKATVTLIALSGAYFVNAVTTIVVTGCFVGIGKLNRFTIYVIARGVVMGVACLLLIKNYGILGAGLAMLSTCIIDIAYFIVVTKRFLGMSPFPVAFETILKPLLCASVAALPFYYFTNQLHLTWLSLISLSVLYVMVLAILMLVTGVVSKSEREFLLGLVQKVFHKYQRA
ncbi:oligosaccharide flippase family protein [Chitinophaga sp. HK235]|uniref:oligosaccharide flippase family protein n=1 Tax=Chitinophaga sp. HK235 TaxID=2952571 RepID=UPI001BABADA8|nr:oligosaccharide flippase family protein [Chitinophaga sp. HK235]